MRHLKHFQTHLNVDTATSGFSRNTNTFTVGRNKVEKITEEGGVVFVTTDNRTIVCTAAGVGIKGDDPAKPPKKTAPKGPVTDEPKRGARK